MTALLDMTFRFYMKRKCNEMGQESSFKKQFYMSKGFALSTKLKNVQCFCRNVEDTTATLMQHQSFEIRLSILNLNNGPLAERF